MDRTEDYTFIQCCHNATKIRFISGIYTRLYTYFLLQREKKSELSILAQQKNINVGLKKILLSLCWLYLHKAHKQYTKFLLALIKLFS